MATLTSKRKGEIAQELRRASTWVGGPRSAKLLALALELEGVDQLEAAGAANDELHQQRVDATPVVPAADEAEGKTTKKRAAKKTAAPSA